LSLEHIDYADMKPKQHYLSQCYQRGFADSSGKVWVKFTDKLIPERRNPDSVGWERALYAGKLGQKIEEFFGKEVENEFAKLSRRIRSEQNNFRTISGGELAILSRFIACQTVRTLAHEECIREQAGGPIDRSTFNSVMIRKLKTMTDAWIEKFPTFHFCTPLPFVSERFITGDHPVLVIYAKQNQVWMPTHASQTDNKTCANTRKPESWILDLSVSVCLRIDSPVLGKQTTSTTRNNRAIYRQAIQ